MAENIYIKYNIDKSKLKRDYILNPLRKSKQGFITKIEEPYKEDIHFLYNICNVSITDLLKYFNVSTTSFYKWLPKKKNKSLITSNIINTFMKKYGCKSSLQNENVNKKARNTCIKKYNHSYAIQNKIILNKGLSTKLKRYGNKNYNNIIKTVETSIKKYGVEHYSKTEEYKKKFEDITYVNSFIHKLFETKRKNGSLGKSKEEDKIYELLKEKYPQTIHHYKSKEYPFVCDFYIPEIDTYIEYQGYFTHGGEPYIGTDEQKEKVKLWESKNKPQYIRAIKTWTIEDTNKRNTAKINEIKYLEFFNINQFMEWYKK